MLSDILPHIEKVKKVGDRYIGCCPVHNDRNPSMSITEKDGRVLMHCFSCQANGFDVVKKLRLSPGYLFANPQSSEIPKRVYDDALEDLAFLDLYEKHKRTGARVTMTDFKRYKLATQRVKVLERLSHG